MTALDHIELSLEQSLDHCIKCNICTAACPVGAVTDLFPGPKYVGPQAQRFRKPGQPSPDESVDYCSGCRVCNEVCPTGVKIMELNTRAKARIVEQRGLPLRGWLLGYQYLFGKLACGPQAAIANFFANNRLVRSLTEQVIGIARHAPLPRFSRFSFRSWFGRRTTGDRQKRQVVYFHGCATNYYEPRIGQAAVEVLEHNGFEVIIPEQGCCGLPLLSNGAFSHAKRHHEYNVARLAPYVERGIPIVGTSTSCTLTLKEEAPELLAMHDRATRMVAENTYDIFEFLRLLHEQGELKTDFQPIEAVLPYHAPCQQRAHRIGRPALDILELVPGLKLNESSAACCGLAGSYGYKAEKYQVAMDVGADLFSWVQQSGSDTAVCDSEICRWQIAHGAGVTMRHPIELLRDAYGQPADRRA
ncbi:MAG TPA: anaerobic glycerol-3-phosphate dehydrogenase subunit C [Roseiflexaceae bacterium]|nr:anaerobic glycerol-3-phosphate dehydrogenase subunit C [Roseiflexaceae bacterium]HMP38786.1 anaerobic glycerol-3-phosphate dehydrogenase subunit C [Roseiflexaceae bacterium]